MSIVYRSAKGSRLTSGEVDNNFAQLDSQGNTIVTQTGFSLAGQNLTINADWVWKIYGNQYTNNSAVVINIPLATSGNQRIDRIVANSSNTFERIPGTQSASNPVAPAVPLGKIEVTIINVTDGLVESGTGPISGQAYVKKESYSPYASNVSGDDAEIVLNPNGYSEIRLTNPALLSIAGVDVAAAISGSEPPYNGKPFRVRNLTGNSITIKHDSVAVTNPFKLNGNTDLVFPNNEIIHFIYDASGMIEDVKSFGAGAVDLSNYYDKSEIDSKLTSIYKFKGNVANFASLPSSGQIAGDVYNVLDTGDNYAWTGSLWDKLSGIVDISGKLDKTTSSSAERRFYGIETDGSQIVVNRSVLKRDNLVTNATVTGTYNLDWLNGSFDLTLTGTTTFTESNLPAIGQTDIIALRVTGNFSLTYPAGWTGSIKGTYNGLKQNDIIIYRISSGRYSVIINTYA